MGRGNLILQCLDPLVYKLEDGAAAGADEVVVVATVELGEFVAGLAVHEVAALGESAVNEQLERAVDGGLAYLGVYFTHPGHELVDAQVALGAEEGLGHVVALARRFEPVGGEVGAKHLAGVFFWLVGRHAGAVRRDLRRRQAAVRGISSSVALLRP